MTYTLSEYDKAREKNYAERNSRHVAVVQTFNSSIEIIKHYAEQAQACFARECYNDAESLLDDISAESQVAVEIIELIEMLE